MMKVKVLVTQCVRLFVTPLIVASQAPLSMEFSRREYWSGLPFPSPVLTRILSPGLNSSKGRFFTFWATREAHLLWSSFYSMCESNL